MQGEQSKLIGRQCSSSWSSAEMESLNIFYESLSWVDDDWVWEFELIMMSLSLTKKTCSIEVESTKVTNCRQLTWETVCLTSPLKKWKNTFP